MIMQRNMAILKMNFRHLIPTLGSMAIFCTTSPEALPGGLSQMSSVERLRWIALSIGKVKM